MGIAYLIISAILIIAFIAVKKSDKKQNLVFWAILSIVLYFIYNTFIAYFLSIVKIPCNLISFTIINTIIIFLLGFNIFVKKRTQKYYIKAIDIISILIILISVLVVSYKEFGFPLRIKYNTTDPAVHYMAAKEFYENSTLLANVEKHTLYDFETFMPASYVNTGMLFKAFDGIVDKLDFYKIYILFDIFCLFLVGATFYLLIINKMRKKLFCIIAIALALVYTLGYPLSIVIYGFAYLSMGILIVNAIIAACKLFKENEVDIRICKAILAMLAFGLFFSYYLFVPVIYSSIAIYFILLYKKGKYIISKEAVITIVQTLVIPFILGFIYFLLPSLLGKGENYGEAITAEGAIYRNLYGNFIIFIPFVLHYFITCIKNKKIKLENIILIILLVFMLGLFILGMKDKVSSYYFYKNYYVLWGITIYIMACELYELSKKDIILPISIITTYVVLIIFTLTEFDTKIYTKNNMWGQEAVSSQVTNIYKFNKDRIKKENTEFTKEEMQIVKKLYELVPINTPVYIVDETLSQLWFYSITGTTCKNSLDEFYLEDYIDISAWNNKKCEYLIYFNSTDYWHANKEQILKDTTTIFENEYGGIIKNN